MSTPRCLGLDTSNYTTSAAVFGAGGGRNAGKLLEVPAGSLGLRQSEALFQHVKRLPQLVKILEEEGLLHNLAAVGASTRPRAVEGSYMPCFLPGESTGRCLASTLGVPFFPCSHQQGHLAAAAWSAGQPELLDKPFLAWHLSGGTTELLYVQPEGPMVHAQKIGGTSDISAGQLIDRTGKYLNIPFPAGRALDELAGTGEGERFSVKINDLTFSLSGVENQVKGLLERGTPPDQTARFVLDTIAHVVRRATQAAQERWKGLPVLCSGGVVPNSRLRQVMTQACGALFAAPEYSTDNALGVAILAGRMLERGGAS